ncbi:MAG TPA: hypothetical protein VGD91_32140, partial [Trebonia sp.]
MDGRRVRDQNGVAGGFAGPAVAPFEDSPERARLTAVGHPLPVADRDTDGGEAALDRAGGGVLGRAAEEDGLLCRVGEGGRAEVGGG